MAYSENTLEELELENKVINFMQNHIDNFSVSECVKLYDFNDELNAYLYIVEKSGYAIISKLTNEIVEFSLTQDSPISIMDSKKIKFYYNGPLAFYKQVNDKIKDLKTGEVFDKRNLEVIHSGSGRSSLTHPSDETNSSNIEHFGQFLIASDAAYFSVLLDSEATGSYGL